MKNTKAKIVVYTSSVSQEVLKEFSSLESFENWIENEKHPRVDIYADQVTINGLTMLGWDEMDDLIRLSNG